MRILIAEDDATSRRMLSAALEKAGYEVVEAVDGEQAWEILQAPDAPTLAILDWIMPGLDGPEVIRRVRQLALPVEPYLIMLTAKGDKDHILSGLEAGANDYLSKPFDVGEVLARIRVGCHLVEVQQALANKISELQHALEEIKTLRGIVPICASCKRIRDDQGYWQQVEVYVRNHSEAEFSHGICPECSRKLYPELE